MLRECAVPLLLFKEAVHRYEEEEEAPSQRFPDEIIAWIFRLLAWRYTLLGATGCFNGVPRVKLNQGEQGTYNEYHIHVPYLWSRDKTVVPTVPPVLVATLIQQMKDNFMKCYGEIGIHLISMELPPLESANKQYTYYITDGEIVFFYGARLGIQSPLGRISGSGSYSVENVAGLGRVCGNPASRVVFIQ